MRDSLALERYGFIKCRSALTWHVTGDPKKDNSVKYSRIRPEVRKEIPQLCAKSETLLRMCVFIYGVGSTKRNLGIEIHSLSQWAILDGVGYYRIWGSPDVACQSMGNIYGHTGDRICIPQITCLNQMTLPRWYMSYMADSNDRMDQTSCTRHKILLSCLPLFQVSQVIF